jgi:hypothetical protein
LLTQRFFTFLRSLFYFGYHELGLGADVRTDDDKSCAWQGLNALAARLTRASGSDSGDGKRATDLSRYGESALITFAADLQSASSGGSPEDPAAAANNDAATNERWGLLSAAVAADWLACCAPQLRHRMLSSGSSRGDDDDDGNTKRAQSGSSGEQSGTAKWQLWKRCWAELAAGEQTLGKPDEMRYIAQQVTQLMDSLDEEA